MTDQASIIHTLAGEQTTKKAIRVYRFRHSHGDTWKHIKINPSNQELGSSWRHMQPADTIRIVTWNLDFETEHQPERIQKALEALQYTIFHCEESTPGPCCLLFQEVTPSGFEAILDHPWVRDHFHVTPAGPAKWPGPHRRYGNVTLIERSIAIYGAALYSYGASKQERTAIGVDVRLRGYTIRLLNTHLESSGGRQNKSERERQLQECGTFVKKLTSGGMIVGDLNPIDDDFDQFAHNLGLKDAGEENEELGHTWGDQRNMNGGDWPNARLDRILYWSPENKYTVTNVERIGIGLRCEALWVSDHFGLMADVVSVK